MEQGNRNGQAADERLKLENQLCFPLYAAARKVVNLYTPFLKPLGLTYTQYIVFLVLWEEDGLTVGEIGEKLHLDNGTLTPLLKKMETAGFVIRKRSSEDERVVRVYLTDIGREKKKAASEIPLQIGSCIRMDRKDAKELYRLLYLLL